MGETDTAVRAVTSHADRIAASELLAHIWGTSIEGTPMQPDLLASLSHAGGSVIGVWRGGALVGVTVGVAGAPCSRQLYSLIAAVLPTEAGAGLGRQLKLAQREWALERGVRRIVWTYDPLIRRNAHFNLNRLGGAVEQFIEDYYPPMMDTVNGGDLTDRFFVVWDIASEPVVVPRDSSYDDAQGAPMPMALQAKEDRPITRLGLDAPVVFAVVPGDIEAIRRADSRLAAEWRAASRESFRDLFGRGYRPTSMRADGCYVFEKGVGA